MSLGRVNPFADEDAGDAPADQAPKPVAEETKTTMTVPRDLKVRFQVTCIEEPQRIEGLGLKAPQVNQKLVLEALLVGWMTGRIDEQDARVWTERTVTMRLKVPSGLASAARRRLLSESLANPAEGKIRSLSSVMTDLISIFVAKPDVAYVMDGSAPRLLSWAEDGEGDRR